MLEFIESLIPPVVAAAVMAVVAVMVFNALVGRR